MNADKAILYGIDPGSSKAWIGYVGQLDLANRSVTCCSQRSWNIADLGRLIEEISQHVSTHGRVLVSLDAPINRPIEFNPPGIDEESTPAYPFNVNPFSTRPCEKALTSKPTRQLESLEHQDIVGGIARLCQWNGDHRNAENRSFADIHHGVNVRGYMGAPHGPVVDLFRTQLKAALGESHICLSISPREATTPRPCHVYLLESHPAVAMAVLARGGCLETIRRICQYKGNNEPNVQAHFTLLRDEVVRYSATVDDGLACHPESDDELDAFVGFLNLVELLKGQGDWFGNIDYGYFLIRRVFDRSIGEVWETAFARAKQAAERQL